MTDPAFPLDPFTGPTLIDMSPTPLAVVRYESVTLADIPSIFDTAYSAVALLFGTGALAPVGPAIAVYRGDPAETFDLDVGFPVAVALEQPLTVGDLTVIGSALPPGPALAATHLGSYDTLGESWMALAHATEATPTQVWIESYVSDPTEAAEQLRTDLIMPVRP